MQPDQTLKHRALQKEKTRQNIIHAAFRQLSIEQGFSSLSLREVTREAGIAPTSFYRHFRDMNELGLAMVDESGLILRQLMRQARKRIERGGSVIETSVKTFIEFIEKEPKVFLLLLKEKAGTSTAFRQAISREIYHFISELVDYLNEANQLPKQYNEAQADAMVTLVFHAGADVIGINDEEKKQALMNKLIFQLRLVSRGAYFLYKKEIYKSKAMHR